MDGKLDTKLDKIILKDVNLNNNQLTNLGYDINDPGDVVNLRFNDQKYLQKVSDSDLDMGTHKIENVKSPEGDNDAVNRGYLNQKISESHINTSDKTNAFQYLKDPDQTSSERKIVVNALGDWTNSPHKYNNRAYDVTLQRHSGADSYDSKIGINLYSAGAGKFTIVFEFYNPAEMSNINITASASTAIIHKQAQRNLINHTKVIVQVNNSDQVYNFPITFFTE